jgi:hypothetical protein
MQDKEEIEERRKIKNNKLIYYTKINDFEKSVEIISKKSITEVDVNWIDECEWSPLHFACLNSNL